MRLEGGGAGQPGGRVRQGGRRPGERLQPGQDGGRQRLLGEHRVHLWRSRLQGRPVAPAVRSGRSQPGRYRRRRGEVTGRQRWGLTYRVPGLRGQRRRLAGGKCWEGDGGDREDVVWQDYRHLDRISLSQAGVALPRAGLVAGGHRGADWRLFVEHRHGGTEAGAAQRRHVVLARAAPDLGQRGGVVLPRQPFGSDTRRLQAETGPLPLVVPPLHCLRIPRLNFYGARPEKVADLNRENKYNGAQLEFVYFTSFSVKPGKGSKSSKNCLNFG